MPHTHLHTHTHTQEPTTTSRSSPKATSTSTRSLQHVIIHKSHTMEGGGEADDEMGEGVGEGGSGFKED